MVDMLFSLYVDLWNFCIYLCIGGLKVRRHLCRRAKIALTVLLSYSDF